MITSKKILGALLGTMLMSVVLVATAPALDENKKGAYLDGWMFTITGPEWRIYDGSMFFDYDSMIHCHAQKVIGKVSKLSIHSISPHILRPRRATYTITTRWHVCAILELSRYPNTLEKSLKTMA